MSRRCELTGRRPRVGHNISHAHNVTKRRFNLNLQRVRALVDGRVQYLTVSTKAIKSGMVTRPPVVVRQRRKRVWETQLPPTPAAGGTGEEVAEEFFSSASLVTRIFKPKAPTPEAAEAGASPEATADAAAAPADAGPAPSTHG